MARKPTIIRHQSGPMRLLKPVLAKVFTLDFLLPAIVIGIAAYIFLQ